MFICFRSSFYKADEVKYIMSCINNCSVCVWNWVWCASLPQITKIWLFYKNHERVCMNITYFFQMTLWGALTNSNPTHKKSNQIKCKLSSIVYQIIIQKLSVDGLISEKNSPIVLDAPGYRGCIIPNALLLFSLGVGLGV